MPMMLRLVRRLRVALILAVLLLVALMPAVASGYADLRHAEQLKRAGEVPLAAQYYEKAAMKLPWKTELWDSAASSYAIAGNWGKAMPLFDFEKRLGLLSSESWVLYGIGYQVAGRSQAALDTWIEGLKHYPMEPTFYYWISTEYRQRNDFAAEAQALSTWVTTGHPRAEHYYRLGQLLMATGPDAARADLQRAASLDDAYAPAADSLEASLDLAALQPDRSSRLVVLGRGLGLVSEWPLAQDDFQQAAHADPRNALAWAWLGEARQQNKLDGKASLDNALAIDSTSALVHALRGLYWRRQAQYSAALAEYRSAAALDTGNAEWQAAVGDSYALTGDLVSALASYQKATSLSPGQAVYWRRLAQFCADYGVQVEDVGLPAARKAEQIAPNDPQVLDTLGWTYAQAGLLYNAEQTLKRVIDLKPQQTILASATLHLAETLLRKGDQAGALRELQLARQIDPDGPAGTLAAQLIQQYFP